MGGWGWLTGGMEDHSGGTGHSGGLEQLRRKTRRLALFRQQR